ncbi:hypothetical protein A33Q_3901 [Indibacter alkaliphilus LW1]|uniref:Uncharacterized protein n=1 Tax=Indibacter alkaliphilus (strain CCUG 57479 / KCTC 22604 / LW1) TaxID=1189612 RepID=S2D6X2_INDAL|nr:hypothetical protein A33Q_3901 [Indibacter alkaliphilus LW1]
MIGFCAFACCEKDNLGKIAKAKRITKISSCLGKGFDSMNKLILISNFYNYVMELQLPYLF